MDKDALNTSDGQEILERYLDAAAAFQGLQISEEWRDGVRDHLTAIKAAAQLVLDYPIDAEIEAAAIFHP
jgi:thymidylate kinase